MARAAYIMVAVAEVVKDKCPVKKKTGDKDPKEWAGWAEDMSRYAKDLAKAAQTKNLNKVKDAASKLNGTCIACHAPFRD